MKTIAHIYANSEQGISIATIKQDYKRTKAYILQDAYTAKTYWFKDLTKLISDITEVDFIRFHAERLKVKQLVIYFIPNLTFTKPRVIRIDYCPF